MITTATSSTFFRQHGKKPTPCTEQKARCRATPGDLRLASGDINLSPALRPLVTRGDPRLGKRPCSLRESPYRPLYSHITRRPARICVVAVAVVVVVIAITALLVQSTLVHRPLVARTGTQETHESNYLDTTTTLPSSDASRQSVTLIFGRSAINAFAIYPFRSLYCRSVPRQAGILQTATIT